MKKTLILLILFLIIGGIAYSLIGKKDTKTTILTEQRKFAVDAIEKVYKIFLADRNGQSVTLERKNGYWELNKRYRANPNAISNLLHTINKVKIKYTPAKAAVKNIINDIATNNIKVEIYDQSNKKINGYYVGGVTNDDLGTYMIKEEAEDPFVTYLPGFEGALRVRYIPEEINWRDKAIFREQMNDIEFVSVEYPKQKNQSFKIERKENDLTIVPFYTSTPKKSKNVPKGVIEQYLVGYERLIAENFVNTYEQKDSIRQLLPFCTIQLKTKDSQSKTVRLYPIIKKNKNGGLILSNEGKPIIEKYYADVNREDFLLIQQLVFGKILWGYDSFYQ